MLGPQGPRPGQTRLNLSQPRAYPTISTGAASTVARATQEQRERRSSGLIFVGLHV